MFKGPVEKIEEEGNRPRTIAIARRASRLLS